MKLSFFSLLVASLLCGLSACKTEPEKIDYENMLLGKWDVVKGVVDGNDMSEDMQGFFFQFHDNQKLTSNFNPLKRGEYSADWKIDEEQEEIVVSLSEKETHRYTMHFEDDEHLQLTTTLSARKVQVTLEKQSDNIPADAGEIRGSEKGDYE